MLRDAGTGLQAREGRDARPSWRYSDAGRGHGIDASLRLVGHRYDAAQLPTMRMDEGTGPRLVACR
jgi:hypothetical protein